MTGSSHFELGPRPGFTLLSEEAALSLQIPAFFGTGSVQGGNGHTHLLLRFFSGSVVFLWLLIKWVICP